jgi:serine/threonine protein kinase/tetratricopeptide (TPR) repeat protein
MPEPARIGPYRIEKRLGAGGMGEVYLGYDERLDRRVAIKQLLPGVVKPELRERFHREARVAARLNHAAIVHLYDVLRDGDIDCIILEYVEGTTLRDELGGKPMRIGRVVEIGRQIADGMAAAHDAGIVHRDLKSENVLLTRTGAAKITDFGIAKITDGESLTADNAIVGTLRAMSPEQAMGEDVDHRSDLFSFGTLLYEALAGRPPFTAPHPMGLLDLIVRKPHAPLRERVPAVPPLLDQLVDQLLAKDPLLRPRDFREVSRVLAEVAAQLGPDQDAGVTATPTAAVAGGAGASAATGAGATSSAAGAGAARVAPGGDTTPTTIDVPLSLDGDPDGSAHVATKTGRPASPPASRPQPADTPDRRGAMGATAAAAGGPVHGVVEAAAEDAATAGPEPTRDLRGRDPRESGAGVSATARLGAPARDWLRAVVALLAVTGGGLGVWAALRDPPGPAANSASAIASDAQAPAAAEPARPRYVAVPRPRIESVAGDAGAGAELGVKATTLRTMLTRTLAGLEGIAVQATEDVDRSQETAASLRELARIMDADEVLATRIGCSDAICTIGLQRVQGADGAVLWTQEFPIPRETFYRHSSAVEAQVQLGYAAHARRADAEALDVRVEDYEQYARLYHGFLSGDASLTPDVLLERLAAIRSASPGFVEAHLLEADVARTRFFHSRDPGDIARARRLVEHARKLAPGSLEPLKALFLIAREGGQLDLADATLQDIERLAPGDPELWKYRAVMLQQRGQIDQALALLGRAVEAHPSAPYLYELAMMEARHGRLDQARAHFEALLQRAPGHYDGQSELARLELMSGDPARAVTLYEALLARSAGFAEYSNHGTARLLAGDFAGARQSLERAFALQPRNPAAAYNLADAEQLAGRAEQARVLYRQTLTLLAADPQASTWSFLALAAQAHAHLGHASEAIAAMQQAMKQAPDNGDLAYAAAAVYAVVGDEASAVVNARRAQEQGYSARWFAFPWFEEIRGRLPPAP